MTNKLTNKYRWKELTYKLIYPAFFGNMVYDFISFFNEHDKYHWTLIAATGFILFFYILDYVHLNVDLENLVPEEKKDGLYMAADIGVSFLLFLVVASIKFQLPEVSVYFVSIVPILFAAYNIKLGYHPDFHKWYRRIAISLLVIFTGLLVYFRNNSSYNAIVNYCLFLICCILTSWYLYYNLKYFLLPKKK